MQAFPQCSGAKVDEQTDGSIRQLEIGQELLAVNRCQSLHGFEFHDDSVLNQEIRAESVLEYHAFVLETDDHPALASPILRVLRDSA